MDKSKTNFKNFSEVLNYWADKAPDKTFINDISANRSYAYSGFNKLVNATVRLLEEQKVKPGDVVSVCVRNSSELLMIYFASIRLGGIINLIPFSLSQKELIHNIDFIKPKLIFLENINSDKISKKHKTFIIKSEGEDSFVNKLKKFSDEDIKREFNEENTACLYYSSGTTSNPKGILCSHKSMITLIDSTCRGFNHTSDTVHFGILPMGHTAIINYSLLPATYMGGTLVFTENFMKIRNNFWDIIQKYKISYVETVPTIIFLILNIKYPNYSREKISSLPYVACGSAPLPEEMQKSFEEKFNIPLLNLYGLSETGQMTFDNPFEKGRKIGGIGKPLDIVEIKIFDEKGEEVTTGVTGEMAVKTKALFKGYYKNKKLYDSCFKNGYFCTGDLGRVDNDGIFYYVDRKKDLIIKGGTNIAPNLIDEVLLKHPAVTEVASVGKPDILLGEVIKSYIVLASGQEVTEKELKDYCKEELGEFKSPSEIEFVDSIPKGPSGKILKRELKQKEYKKTFGRS